MRHCFEVHIHWQADDGTEGETTQGVTAISSATAIRDLMDQWWLNNDLPVTKVECRKLGDDPGMVD